MSLIKKRRGGTKCFVYECTNNLHLKTREHINFTTKKKVEGLLCNRRVVVKSHTVFAFYNHLMNASRRKII